ncbi:MAG TPA: succinate dehydrogenase cytochrome b subunit [Bryobacteraceae bacterium]|nr:succinate dehydrogenase cytochrome b subunit [Bryobacteraceae bacterium]
MSAPAVGMSDRRAAGFYDSVVGKKVVMAVSGVVLFGYVVAHLLGNLQIFLGPDQINHYAALLHASPPLLWTARIFLLIMLFLHVWSCWLLFLQKRAARPEPYVKKRAVGSDYASRTMYWSGPIVGAFVIYHIMHLTLGVGGTPYIELHPYENVVHGFRNPIVAGFYIVALILLCTHLYHGLWSMFQTLGINHPRYTPWLKRGAQVVAILIAIGEISIPIAVLLGIVGGEIQ